VELPVKFQTEKNGYAKQQVDMVIEGLTGEYEKIYNQYLALEEKNKAIKDELNFARTTNGQLAVESQNRQAEITKLTEKVRQLEATTQTVTPSQQYEKVSSDFMESVLKQSQELIKNAKEEAADILRGARIEYETMQSQKIKLYTELQEMVKGWSQYIPGQK